MDHRVEFRLPGCPELEIGWIVAALALEVRFGVGIRQLLAGPEHPRLRASGWLGVLARSTTLKGLAGEQLRQRLRGCWVWAGPRPI